MTDFLAVLLVQRPVTRVFLTRNTPAGVELEEEEVATIVEKTEEVEAGSGDVVAWAGSCTFEEERNMVRCILTTYFLRPT